MRSRPRKPASKDPSSAVTRASVTFPTALYQALEEIARLKKVSVAWVVRDAAERYVAEQYPKLAK
ncbi:MAG: ribbon-helix-helix protein, CopG family [Alphaproteobacteria bacterium]|nr:ribbon-helix-helix protein, CopG family [Alphaproteobacteria bacterium]